MPTDLYCITILTPSTEYVRASSAKEAEAVARQFLATNPATGTATPPVLQSVVKMSTIGLAEARDEKTEDADPPSAA